MILGGLDPAEVEARRLRRCEVSRLLDTRRKPSPITNPTFGCECCPSAGRVVRRRPWHMVFRPKYFAEYFAQTGAAYFFALCPHCWRGLPAAVRRQYARK